jgi:hypothetical protein
MPLAEHLVNFAAVTNLVFQLTGFFVPVSRTIKMLSIALIFKINFVVEVLAVEKILFCPAISVLENFRIFFFLLVIASKISYFCCGFQRGKVYALEPGGGAKQFHIKRMMLSTFQDTIFISIPFPWVLVIPCIFQCFLDIIPIFLQPFGVAGDFPITVNFNNG